LSVAEFSQVLQTVGIAVPARSPNQAMLNVLISPDGSLSATDGELFITAKFHDAAGVSALIPYARLLQIVKSCDQTGEIKLKLNGDTCAISCGKGSWSLPTAPVSSFPVEKHSHVRPMSRLPADQFRTMMSQVKFAVDDKNGRGGMNGVLLDFKEGCLAFVASDGHRIACTTADIDQACDDATAIIPKKSAEALWRLAGSSESVQLEVSENELLATLDSTSVWVRLLSGKFIDWRKLTPDRDVASSAVTAGELMHTCDMAAICTSDESKGVGVTLSRDGVSMIGSSSDRGTSKASCALLELGTECSVKLNPDYITEWLWPIDSSAIVEIEAVGPADAVVLRCDDSYTVIMPMSSI
jgi:DNA polymerase-3 subunit beta